MARLEGLTATLTYGMDEDSSTSCVLINPSLAASRIELPNSAMDLQAPIFCCSSAEECGRTHESLGQKLEPFMKWAREKATSQDSNASGTYILEFLIEIVTTRQNAPRQPSSMFFVIANNPGDPNAYREFPTIGSRQMYPWALAEECRVLVCNKCQLSYSVFLFKRRPQGESSRR